MHECSTQVAVERARWLRPAPSAACAAARPAVLTRPVAPLRVAASDGVMVARGDLGAQVPFQVGAGRASQGLGLHTPVVCESAPLRDCWRCRPVQGRTLPDVARPHRSSCCTYCSSCCTYCCPLFGSYTPGRRCPAFRRRL